MIPLATQPVLQLVDRNGNPVAAGGQVVTTSVVGGGGKIFERGSATTDASGLAAFETLTLGANNGEIGPTTLSFSTGGSTSATAQIELACAVRIIELGSTVSDKLTTGDCKRVPPASATAFFKEYRLNVTAPTKAIRLSHSGDFPGYLLVRGPNEPTLFFGFGSDDDDFTFKVFVPPGASTILATTPIDGMTGSFTFSVVSAPEDEPECEDAQFQSPLSTNQTLRPACKDAVGKIGDFFGFDMLNAGAVSVSVASTAFVPQVVIVRTHPTEAVAATGSSSGGTASANHVNQTGGIAYYNIFVTSSDGTGTGAYTLQATITNATGSAVLLSRDAKLGEAPKPPNRPSARTSMGRRPNEMLRTHRAPIHRN